MKDDEFNTILCSTFLALKKDDRQDDWSVFFKESESCTTEELKGLSEWYLSKPNGGKKE